jgi:hypothetical protein
VNVTPLHLSEIYLSGFRGIEQSLPLRFGKRLTIIYGGNATGKSSVTQAIEFALSGQVLDFEEGVIPGQYLVNTHVSAPGHVALTLSDGTILTAHTSDKRTDIESRFREVCGVEWPERQGVPLSATHVTSQGMLAKILAVIMRSLEMIFQAYVQGRICDCWSPELKRWQITLDRPLRGAIYSQI